MNWLVPKINHRWVYTYSHFFSIRLLEEFVNHIQELQIMDERIQRKVEKLEQQCQKEAKEFAKKVQELQKSNQVNI